MESSGVRVAASGAAESAGAAVRVGARTTGGGGGAAGWAVGAAAAPGTATDTPAAFPDRASGAALSIKVT